MIDQLIGQTLADKYRIEELWREDAISKTYRATRLPLDKPVTLKVLTSALTNDAVVRLEAEARTLSRISSPHVLNVLDYGADEQRGVPFLVLEDVRGETLREFISENGGSPVPRAANIINQIADALVAAHANKIVHGNLSSDKILIGNRNGAQAVKVLDFGATNSADINDEQTSVGNELPFYRAPEQLSDQEAPDARADVYGLGVLLYEVLTARLPFTAENSATLAQKHLNEIPPSLIAARPDLPPLLEQVVQRALAKQPDQRYQTVAEFADALNRAANSDDPESASAAFAGNFDSAITTQSAATAETNTNNPYKTAFIVLAGICLLSVFGIYLTGGFRDTPTASLNADPNSQPAQPINPVSGNVENPNDLGLAPIGNSNLDPLAVPQPNTVPGAVPNVPQSIPPGLYPPGYNPGGQTVVVPGDSNSPFTTDYYPVNVPVNANVVGSNANVNAAANANARPTANVNVAASPRPENTNSGGSITSTPAPTPTAAPVQTPRPRASPAKPADTPPKPNSNSTDNSSASNSLE